MNAPRPKTDPLAVVSRYSLAALSALAPLLIFGCVARTPLRSTTNSSAPEGTVDTGGETSETTGAAGASGWNTAAAAGAGGAEVAGGSVATGGSSDTGGALAGAVAGAKSTGGTKSTGSTSRDGGVSPDGAAPPGTPVISDSGYVQVSAGTTVLAGFVSSSEGGSGSTISLTYGPSSFCASGTVGKNSTYNCWATAGFAVNQSQTGASGSSSSLALTGSTITVSYVNKGAQGGSQLELQLYDGSDYWCSYLSASTTPTSETIPFSKFNTKCWDGSGTAFVSGTPITAVDLVVPGSAVAATPFDFCFLGMTVQ